MQTGTALAEHYASGDLFLFPSLTETYGIVVAEALASGPAEAADALTAWAHRGPPHARVDRVTWEDEPDAPDQFRPGRFTRKPTL